MSKVAYEQRCGSLGAAVRDCVRRPTHAASTSAGLIPRRSQDSPGSFAVRFEALDYLERVPAPHRPLPHNRNGFGQTTVGARHAPLRREEAPREKQPLARLARKIKQHDKLACEPDQWHVVGAFWA